MKFKTLATIPWTDDDTSVSDNIIKYCKTKGIEFRYNHYFQLEILLDGVWIVPDYTCPSPNEITILIYNKRRPNQMKTHSCIHIIEMEINNGRTMQLAQQKYDGTITLTTYNAKSGEVDHEENITPGDMVMLLNYFHFQKENGLPIF